MAELGFHWPSLLVYLVNFTALLIVLYMVGFKPILRVLDERSRRIQESMDQAQVLQEESVVRQGEMDQQIKDARKEGQAVIEQARQSKHFHWINPSIGYPDAMKQNFGNGLP